MTQSRWPPCRSGLENCEALRNRDVLHFAVGARPRNRSLRLFLTTARELLNARASKSGRHFLDVEIERLGVIRGGPSERARSSSQPYAVIWSYDPRMRRLCALSSRTSGRSSPRRRARPHPRQPYPVRPGVMQPFPPQQGLVDQGRVRVQHAAEGLKQSPARPRSQSR